LCVERRWRSLTSQNYGTDVYYARRGVPGFTEPHIANGYGAAVGLLGMIIVSSLALHHFFFVRMRRMRSY